ncbi:uncharacterized protein LOC125198954 [Salvia hispanica]|uniref:uncharacterized protein LOC125198954 n=1 Tax=Salvia hispanica TaxID=49212 RepID=UPI00200918BB|nr:uncharacterized protein LOC125198954 [Salvia hispanica]
MRVDTIISTVMEDIHRDDEVLKQREENLNKEKVVSQEDDEVLKQREENLNKDKGKKMVSQDPPVEKEKVVRTTKKIVEAMCSPYNVRAVNLKGKLNKEEREIMYWLMADEESEHYEVVYENDKITLFKIDFHSLAPRTYVRINIIDAWVVFLNYNEKFKSKASPSRLFINTTPTIYNITARRSGWTEAESRERFCSNLNEFVSKIENFKWENYDLIFFPIWAYEHYYIICFNLKMQMMDVIDNSLVSEELIEKKYEDTPSTLKNFFRIYLGNGVNPSMGRTVKLSKTRYMNMPWQNDTNKVDCGIYVMRHLETYMGGPVRNWNSGLTKKGTESFIKLRARYTEALLIGDTNKKAFDTFTMIQKKFENDSKKGEIDVEKMIREFKPPEY